MSVQIKLITNDEFDSMQTEWNEILGKSRADNVFLRWEWIHTWWEVFKRRKSLFIATARIDGRLAGIAPFYIEKPDYSPVKYLRFCSQELAPDYMDIILDRDEETLIATEFIRFLKNLRQCWDVMALDNLRHDSILLADVGLWKSHRLAVQQSHCCPYVAMKGTFDEYCQDRKAYLSRFSLKKKLRILRQSKQVTHAIIDNEDSLARGLEGLFTLHEKRVSSRHIHSTFLTRDARNFHSLLSRRFLSQKILNLQLLYNGDIPISASYAFNYKNKVSVYQTGFDPQWAKWSVGGVLTFLSLEKAFLQGFTEFDLLRGSEPYKSFWANAAHQEWQFVLYNDTWGASCVRGIDLLGANLKKIGQLDRTINAIRRQIPGYRFDQ